MCVVTVVVTICRLPAGLMAGGGSTRMGRNKALLPLEGRPVLAWVLAAVAAAADDVVICANDADTYAPFGHRVVRDPIPGKGAMGGVYAAVCAAAGRPAIVVGCDLPFITGAVLRSLAARRGAADVIVARSARGLEPLCAVYGPGCGPILAGMLAADELALRDLIARVPHVALAADDFPAGILTPWTFHNLNTPAEYEAAGRAAAAGLPGPGADSPRP